MGPLLAFERPPPSPARTSHSPSSTTVSCKRSQTLSNALNPSFANLPTSLLEMIMSDLVLKDNIRASAACKSWLEAAVYVRVVEKHPWLLCFHKGSKSFKLCDPLRWESHTLDLPELDNSTVCYSRDGWLLMSRSITNDIFFFNPFSRELISLPKFELPFKEIAFSCPPTLDHCVVIGLYFDEGDHERYRGVLLSTCRPGDTEWSTDKIRSPFPLFMQTKLVYLNGHFYCFNSGTLGFYSFQVSSRTWTSHTSAYIYQYHPDFNGNPKAAFLAEKNGELFLMLTCGNERPVVYKLVYFRWIRMSRSELDGLTFFVSFFNSEVRTDLPWMRNNVYFSRFGYNRKRCVSYLSDENRYDPPKVWLSWLEVCPPSSLWIDPPKNFLDNV